MTERETILVLGGSGFLGPHALAAVRARFEADVVSASRVPSAAPLLGRAGGAAREVTLDLLEEGALERLLDELAPARVLNCAALSRAADCLEDPARADALNAGVPRRLAEWSAARGARLVHVSTDLVFGATLPPPGGFREEDEPGPVSLYGRTKLAGERAVQEADPAALVVRLPLLYGDSGGRELGASDQVLAARQRGERPRLFVDEWRTPLEVGAAGRALAELLGRTTAGLLHVAGPERVTRMELGCMLLETFRMPPGVAAASFEPARRAELSGPEERPEDTALDARRARALLSCELPGLREGLIAATTH